MNPTGGEESQTRQFYLGVDELLDTRLGVLAKYFPKDFVEYCTEALPKALHHIRASDVFGRVSYTRFAQAYAKRAEGPGVLEASIITNIPRFLAEVLRDAINESIAEPFRGTPVVHLNTWPYTELYPKELWRDMGLLLQDRLKRYVGMEVPIVLIDLSPEQLDAKRCHEVFKAMFMYEPGVWLDAQLKQFQAGVRLPHTTLFAPAIIQRELTSEDETAMENLINRGFKPLESFRLLASAFIPTELVDVRLFSAYGWTETPHDVETDSKPYQNPFEKPTPSQDLEDGIEYPDPRSEAPPPDDPTMTYTIHDPKTGQIRVISGDQERVVRAKS